MKQLDISVLIATRNRAESLRTTLECLASADRGDLDVEVVVIDNGSDDDTLEVARCFAGRIAVRLLEEPTPGKGNCLNRALKSGGLGRLVAVLDDDMSPEPGWFTGVKAISDRWPDKDVFSGASYVIWPTDAVPRWAKRGRFNGWIYSVIDRGQQDVVLKPGAWPSGNHYWFRSRALRGGARFCETWAPSVAGGRRLTSSSFNSDARFMLDLMEEGCEAVMGPDAVTGHRVQPALLDKEVVRARAIATGRMFAETRLRPFRPTLRHARLLRAHRIVGRAFLLTQMVRWSCVRLVRLLHPNPDERFERNICASHFLAYYQEAWRIADVTDEYRLALRRPLRSVGAGRTS